LIDWFEARKILMEKGYITKEDGVEVNMWLKWIMTVSL
jgi:hypothetical protein